MYYRGANAAVIVFDITEKESLNTAKDWVAELQRSLQDEIIISIVGNKIDLEEEREISKEEGTEFASSIKASYSEVSAKTGEGINDVFLALTKSLLETMAPVTFPPQFSLERIDKPFRNDENPSTPCC